MSSHSRRRADARRREMEALEKEAAKRSAEREAEIMQLEYERRQREKALEARVEERHEFLLVDHEARKQLNAEITRQRAIELPEVDWTAADFIAENDEPMVEVIEGLHYRGYNTLLAAEFKTGKTTMAMNLAASLADGVPFLDRFKTNFPFGRVGFFNYELYPRQFREWLRDLHIENEDRIVPLNMRGWRLPFWQDETLLRTAEWLLHNRIKFLIMDPAARAWRGLVEHEGDNVQLSEFFGAIDELKRLGEVSDLLITTHTPRQSGDRARGGGEIEAWPDGNWYLRKGQGNRTMRIEGRMDGPPETFDIIFEEDTRRLQAGAATQARTIEWGVEQVVGLLQARGRVSATELKEGLVGKTNAKRDWIAEALERELIQMEQEGPVKWYELKA